MKKTLTLSAVAALFLVMATSAVNAATPAKAAKLSKEVIRRQIINTISCPGFVQDNNAVNDVKAIVEVDANGKVTITDINSANPKLLQYVTAQLQNMTVKNGASPDKFILTIRFRVE